jgi:hypothetical protein
MLQLSLGLARDGRVTASPGAPPSGRAVAGAPVPHAPTCPLPQAGRWFFRRCHGTCSWLLPRLGRSLLWEPWNDGLNSPELVAVPCPECHCSRVEVLMRMPRERRFLWCPQCAAIWAVAIWVLNRPPSLPDATEVIAHASIAARRLF